MWFNLTHTGFGGKLVKFLLSQSLFQVNGKFTFCSLCSSEILRMWFFFLLTLVFQEYIPIQSGSGINLTPYYAKYSNRTQQAILYMNPYKINLELILELLAYLGTSSPLLKKFMYLGLSFGFIFHCFLLLL